VSKKLLIAALLLLSIPASAEEFLLKKPVVCNTLEELDYTVRQYGEIILFKAHRNVSMRAPGEIFNSTLTVYMTPNMDSYTIIEHLDDETGCILGMGENLTFGEEPSKGLAH